MKITIYSKPDCVQCDATKRWFKKEEIPFEDIDLTKDEEAMAKVIAMGYSSAPVVVTDTDDWSGFRISKIQDTVAEFKRENKKEPLI